jgi:hypothetical protein
MDESAWIGQITLQLGHEGKEIDAIVRSVFFLEGIRQRGPLAPLIDVSKPRFVGE